MDNLWNLPLKKIDDKEILRYKDDMKVTKQECKECKYRVNCNPRINACRKVVVELFNNY